MRVCTFYCEKLPTAVDKCNNYCPFTTWCRRRRQLCREKHHQYIGVADGIFSFSTPSEAEDDDDDDDDEDDGGGGAIVIFLLMQ